MDKSIESNDPYKLLTEGINKMSDPLNRLLETHSEFLVQNLNIMNNTSTIPKVTETIETSLKEKEKK
ncbi:Mph1 protein [Scheffersomyces coipomensis]|uniref:Mph1 protein n=1 Tax=Scheffersomyces coipomensis TaxID=1788519 RepID=UPI00315DAA1B